jgi:hypothetical protein
MKQNVIARVFFVVIIIGSIVVGCRFILHHNFDLTILDHVVPVSIISYLIGRRDGSALIIDTNKKAQ